VSPSADARFSSDSKYYPLHVHFLDLPTSIATYDISFEEVEDAIGQPLPTGARSHRAWWGNSWTGHSQSRAWLLAGWKLVAVDLEAETASYERLPPEGRA
jgi:hypothetical protein